NRYHRVLKHLKLILAPCECHRTGVRISERACRSRHDARFHRSASELTTDLSTHLLQLPASARAHERDGWLLGHRAVRPRRSNSPENPLPRIFGESARPHRAAGPLSTNL